MGVIKAVTHIARTGDVVHGCRNHKKPNDSSANSSVCPTEMEICFFALREYSITSPQNKIDVYHGVEPLDGGVDLERALERMNSSNGCQKHTFNGPIDEK